MATVDTSRASYPIGGCLGLLNGPLLPDQFPIGSSSSTCSSSLVTSHPSVVTKGIDDSSWLLKNIANTMPTPPESPPPNSSSVIKNEHVSSKTTSKSLHNLLGVSTSNPDRYFITRQCCYAFHCLSLNAHFSYPVIPNKLILRDERVRLSVEAAATAEFDDRGLEHGKDENSYSVLLAKHTARANQLLNTMRTAISTSLIRLTGYVLFKVFSRLLMSVTVNRGQLEMIEKASSKDIPLIFVPLHRSHVDYLFVTWVLFNLQIPAPIVAAGDNLRIPVFGCLLRGLGGFFIKRRLESTKSRKDVLYRSVLQTYISHSLQAGYNMEFFIEGGRTRTGKACMPKGGLLSVIVDAYMNAALDDALIVPIAMNYDKILDGNFIREQLGQNKVPESFWGATRAIIKVLYTNYGYARIDFGQPFSLKEFVQNSKVCINRGMNNPPMLATTPPDSPASSCDNVSTSQNVTECFQPPVSGHQRSLSSPPGSEHLSLQRTLSNPSSVPTAFSSNKNQQNSNNSNLVEARSNSSLFGTELNDEYRRLVNALASHIVYDAERCQAIMSTNAVSWLLCFVFRSGTSFLELTQALDSLRETLQSRGRDTGFSGTSADVALHAIKLLGNGLVRLEIENKILDEYSILEDNETHKNIKVIPVTILPNIIELSYYANALTPLFAVDSIVATSILTMIDCNIWSYKNCPVDIIVSYDKIVSRASRLCEIFRNEFLYIPSCGRLEDKLRDAIDRLVYMGFLIENQVQKTRGWQVDESDSDSDNDSLVRYYTLSPTDKNIEVLTVWINMLTPLLDAYYCTAYRLKHLIGKESTDKQFILETKDFIQECLKDETLTFGESIAVDPIRNSIKYFEQAKVIESSQHDTTKVVCLKINYNSEEYLDPVISEINSYRISYPH